MNTFPRNQLAVAIAAAQALAAEETIIAQHDETGRLWEGKRKDIPPRFAEVIVFPTPTKRISLAEFQAMYPEFEVDVDPAAE